MASIQKRNNKYVVIYRYTDDQDNTKQKWESCENYKAARARKSEIENEIESGHLLFLTFKVLRIF